MFAIVAAVAVAAAVIIALQLRAPRERIVLVPAAPPPAPSAPAAIPVAAPPPAPIPPHVAKPHPPRAKIRRERPAIVAPLPAVKDCGGKDPLCGLPL